MVSILSRPQCVNVDLYGCNMLDSFEKNGWQAISQPLAWLVFVLLRQQWLNVSEFFINIKEVSAVSSDLLHISFLSWKYFPCELTFKFVWFAMKFCRNCHPNCLEFEVALEVCLIYIGHYVGLALISVSLMMLVTRQSLQVNKGRHCSVVSSNRQTAVDAFRCGFWWDITVTLHEHHGISDHQQLDCLFNSEIMLTSKGTSSSVLLPLCEGNPLVTSGFPSQRATNAENVSISWHHHDETLWRSSNAFALIFK